jgi:hypothetical protein
VEQGSKEGKGKKRKEKNLIFRISVESFLYISMNRLKELKLHEKVVRSMKVVREVRKRR